MHRGNKIGSSWKGAAAAATLLVALLFGNQYRYTFLSLVGLRPSGLCNKIVMNNNGAEALNDYLNHGGSIHSNNEIRFPRTFDNLEGYSLLNCVVKGKQNKSINYLIKRGINPNKPSQGNDFMSTETPLQTAVIEQNAEAFVQLVSLGANPHHVDNNNSSLWHILAVNPFPDGQKGYKTVYDRENHQREIQPIIKQLLKSNVDFNKPNNSGDTPLHKSIQRGNQVLIDVLLELGVKPSIADTKGITEMQSYRYP
jgi:ankyrin repeat protein